jgi:hypothetical protein
MAQSYHYVFDCDMSCAADTKGGGRTSTVVARTVVALYASIAAEDDERWLLVVAMGKTDQLPCPIGLRRHERAWRGGFPHRRRRRLLPPQVQAICLFW